MRKLLEVLHRLTDLGNTIIIIEHNLDVVRNADYVLDMGPKAAKRGGRIVAHGTPEQIATVPGSYTGHFLARHYHPRALSLTTGNNGASHAGPQPIDVAAAARPPSHRPWQVRRTREEDRRPYRPTPKPSAKSAPNPASKPSVKSPRPKPKPPQSPPPKPPANLPPSSDPNPHEPLS